jgi:hypothetical protein
VYLHAASVLDMTCFSASTFVVVFDSINVLLPLREASLFPISVRLYLNSKSNDCMREGGNLARPIWLEFRPNIKLPHLNLEYLHNLGIPSDGWELNGAMGCKLNR